jgi:hypothetical protein
VICISIFLIVMAVCIFDFKLIQMQFDRMIAWIRLNPYPAVGAILALYALSAVFTMPTTFTHIMLGFTYS